MAGNSRAESVRHIVELTGLGIAATYFLDPHQGATRRRAAWRWVAGARREPPPAVETKAPSPQSTTAEAEPPAEEPPSLPDASSELVLLSRDRVLTSAGPRPEAVEWPRWGWTLVVTITICAVAAFAAVGLGIWAIENGSGSTTRTVTTVDTRAAPVLADPAAARVIGTATEGSVLLRLDTAGSALAVAGLPPLSPDARYRVWITAGGTTTPAGSFGGRRAILTMGPLASGSRVTITREEAGPTPNAPRGPQVATVTVR